MLPRLFLLLALVIGLTHSGLHDIALLLSDAGSAVEASSALPETEPTDDAPALIASSFCFIQTTQPSFATGLDHTTRLRNTHAHTYQAQAPPLS